MSAYSIPAEALAALGKANVPDELRSDRHLIYSSPATLAFNSPGANGFGVKRAGLCVPGSVMLLVSPGCCGRNTTLESVRDGYRDRFYFLLQDSTDIVTGRHLKKITDAVCRIAETAKPSCVMVCITCVDALLGTDMQAVCDEASAKAGLPVVPCYMYALTREQKLPPMASVRRSVYSMLEKQPRKGNEMNILGHFAPLVDDCELYELLKGAGIRVIREISRCASFDEYKQMSRANFNLVLHPESVYAAEDMKKNLGIPYIQMTRVYRPEKIDTQYRLLAQALGIDFDTGEYRAACERAAGDFRKKRGSLRIAVGECLNADPFELSLFLIGQGHRVPVIFGTVGEANFPYINALAKVSPQTRVFSNLSPTMMTFDPAEYPVELALGDDAGYYYDDAPCVPFRDETQPFGFAGVRLLLERMDAALEVTR